MDLYNTDCCTGHGAISERRVAEGTSFAAGHQLALKFEYFMSICRLALLITSNLCSNNQTSALSLTLAYSVQFPRN